MVQDCLNFRALDTEHLGNFGHTSRLVTWVVSAWIGEVWVACKESQILLPSSQTSDFLIPAYTNVSTTSFSL
jgi:hypothetical protein